MSNILDLMTPEDRQKSLEAFEKRMAGDTSFRANQKISPVSFMQDTANYGGNSRIY